MDSEMTNISATEDMSSNAISTQSGPTSIAFRYNESPPGASRTERQSTMKKTTHKQELDFIGPSTSIKELFSIPYSNDTGVAVAVHNMGDGTLLLDGGVFPKNGDMNNTTYPTTRGSNESGARDNVSMKEGRTRRRNVRPRSSISDFSNNHQDKMQAFHENQLLGNESAMAMITSILQRHQNSYALPQSKTANDTPIYSPGDSPNDVSLVEESSDGSKVSESTSSNPPSLGTSTGSNVGDSNQMILPKPEDYTSNVVTYPEAPRQYLPWNFGDYSMLVASDALVVRSEDANVDENEECGSSMTVGSISNQSYHRNTKEQGLTLRLAESSDLKRQFNYYTSTDNSSHSQSSTSDQIQSYAEAVITSKKEEEGYTKTQEENEGTIQHGTNILLPPSENFNLAINLQTCIIPSPRFQSNLCGYRILPPDESSLIGNEDTSTPVCTVLDAYLDNIICNVPHLALCLQEKGFIQSVKLLRTEQLPNLALADLEDVGDVPESSDPGIPLFSPSVVESNAAMLLDFLKTNCAKENSTYLLRRNPGETDIHLYDITTISKQKHRKWIWWLAMMSYRFALRLDQLAKSKARPADDAAKRNFRSRCRNLLKTSLELLDDLADMEGTKHETVIAAIYEHLADTFLWDVDIDTSSPDDKMKPSSTISPQPYEYITVDGLTKAQDYLNAGILELKPALDLAEENINFGGRDRRENVNEDEIKGNVLAMQMYGLHYKFINVSLRLAEHHLRTYWSSSATQALRTAGRKVAESSKLINKLQYLDESTSPSNAMSETTKFVRGLAYQYGWLWEDCGNFARSFAADEMWRERGVTSGDDVISLLRDVEYASSDVKSLLFQNWSNQSNSEIEQLTGGNCNLYDLDGILPLNDTGDIDISIFTEESFKEAKLIISRQRQLQREERQVLVAAAVTYSYSANIYGNLTQKASELDSDESFNFSQSVLSVLRQRLGDSCNEIGKILLRELKKILSASESHSSLKYFLLSAEFWFTEGLRFFKECGNAQNIALLLCNVSQCCKIRANDFIKLPRKPLKGGRDVQSKEQGGLAEVCLQDAAKNLQLAHEALDQRDSDPKTWDMVSDELAATFLVLGVKRRQSLIGDISKALLTEALRLNPGSERSISEPLFKAKNIYESLQNHHQCAAVNYQLALFYSKIWTCQRDEVKTKEKLSAALNHFRASHIYFHANLRSNEITFVLLCLDLSKLYSTVSLEKECIQKALLCCLDTCDTFGQEAIRGAKERNFNNSALRRQNRSNEDWFNKMTALSSSVEERIFQLVRDLAKLEESEMNPSLKEDSSFKGLYRQCLMTKIKNEKKDPAVDEEFPVHSILCTLKDNHRKVI